MSDPTTIRAAWGAVLLIAPGSVVRMLPEQPTGRRVRDVARLLGLRHLAQAAILRRTRSPGWRRAGVAVDAVHAISMLALARAAPRHRGLALADAAAAGLFTAAGARRVRA